MKKSSIGIIQILPSRVFRIYRGGYLLEKFRGIKNPQDSDYPEDWILSTVKAMQPYGISDESISNIKTIKNIDNLEVLIKHFPEDILGKGYVNKFSDSLNLLVKLLDSSIRLPLQAHPGKIFSRKYLNSDFGKAEAWYILATRKIGKENPYVLIGFKPGINKNIMRKMVEEQDIKGIISFMHKIEVKPGDAIFVAPGIPHAIGEGVFMVETQEPTDFSILVEKNIGTHILKEKDCHIGLGWDKALDIFDYQGYSLPEINEKYQMKKETLSSNRGGKLFRLNGGEYMKSCFEMLLMEEVKDIKISFEGRFASIVIARGEGIISTNVGDFEVKEGETYVIPASIDVHRYLATKKNLDIVISLPPISQ
ncbi:MAG: class I mannose-6-phosphate isomerase [Candidatus Caldatribacteriota bacterium]|nr:class I mannose-6-phosphate isomerase [Candidatus Caldatribacteriota bacterium]